MTAKITAAADGLSGSLAVGATNVANFTTSGGFPFCKNKLFNGEVTRINQRGFNGNWTPKGTWNSGNTIAQQELCYGWDMWAKASATDMLQVIEAGNFRPSTQHVLSGTGVTTQVLTSPASGNWTITVPQAARNVQVEEGGEATPFEQRPISFELAQCQRYYWAGLPVGAFNFPAFVAGAVMSWVINFPVTLRAVPLLGIAAPGATYVGATDLNFSGQTRDGARIVVSSTLTTNNASVSFAPTDIFAASAVI